MPRRFIRRWLPASLQQRPGAPDSRMRRWLAPLLDDPNLLHLNRHSVSGAFFVGLFCAFLPVPGQALIASLLAFLFRCNLPISVLLIWISNPFTIPPIMVGLYKIGQYILGRPSALGDVSFSWTWLSENGGAVFLPIAIAGPLVGLVAGLTGYITIRYLWRWKVVKNWEIRKKKRQSIHS